MSRLGLVTGVLGLLVLSGVGVAGSRPGAAASPETRIVAAAPRPFGIEDWRAATSDRSHAQVIVFTTQDCAYCAQEVRRIAAALREHAAARVVLRVVALDGRASAVVLIASGQYAAAARIDYADGDEQRLRYRVNPRWRGETPYIASIPRAGPVRFALGHAAAADLQAVAGD